MATLHPSYSKTDFKHYLLEKAFSVIKSIASKFKKFCRYNQRGLLLAPSTSCYRTTLKTMEREWCYCNLYYHTSGLLCCSYSEAPDSCAAPLGTLWESEQQDFIPMQRKNIPHGAPKSGIGMSVCPFSLNPCPRLKREVSESDN